MACGEPRAGARAGTSGQPCCMAWLSGMLCADRLAGSRARGFVEQAEAPTAWSPCLLHPYPLPR